jgi:hypothetical protein
VRARLRIEPLFGAIAQCLAGGFVNEVELGACGAIDDFVGPGLARFQFDKRGLHFHARSGAPKYDQATHLLSIPASRGGGIDTRDARIVVDRTDGARFVW